MGEIGSIPHSLRGGSELRKYGVGAHCVVLGLNKLRIKHLSVFSLSEKFFSLADALVVFSLSSNSVDGSASLVLLEFGLL